MHSLPKIDKQMNNKKKGITIVIAAYIASLVAAYFSINAHIQTKDEKLRREIFSNISDMFGGDRVNLVDVNYHGKNVVYKQIDIPKQPDKKYSSVYTSWEDYYGDLFKLYRISNDESGAIGIWGHLFLETTQTITNIHRRWNIHTCIMDTIGFL